MESALEYMTQIAADMTHSYEHFHCTELAKEVARRLVHEGSRPEVIRFGKKNNLGVLVSAIHPLKYKETVWKYHDVAVAHGQVYDPMLGPNPIPLEQYQKRAFGKEFPIEVSITSNTLLNWYGK